MCLESYIKIRFSFCFSLLSILLLLNACTPSAEARYYKKSSSSLSHTSLGLQKVLVLAVSFPDVDIANPLFLIEKRVLGKTAKYYDMVSYGKTRIVGDVKGWYQLPHDLSAYKVPPYLFQLANNRKMVKKLVEDSLSSAEKDITYSNYDQIIIVLGINSGPGKGYGLHAYCANPGVLSGVRHGKASMVNIKTRGGQKFNGGIVVISQNAHPGQIIHDFTHAIGGVIKDKRVIPDLYGFEEYDKALGIASKMKAKQRAESFDEIIEMFTIYMGPWDIMSRHIIGRGLPLAGMSSFTRIRMGWIGDDQITEVKRGHDLAAMLSPLGSGKGILAIRIPVGRKKYYLIENRQKMMIDRTIPAPGILILKVNEALEDGDGIVRIVDANPNVRGFKAATYGVNSGQTTSVNLSRDHTLEILWKEGKELAVMIVDPSKAKKVQDVAEKIRKAQLHIQTLPPSSMVNQVRDSLKISKDLLFQRKINDSQLMVESILETFQN